MKTLTAVLFFGLTLVFFGCGRNAVSPVKSTNDDQLPRVVPAQVQTLLDRYALPDVVIADQLDRAPSNSELPDFSGYDVYAVTILWGDLLNSQPDFSVTTDWSGTLSVNGVAFVNVQQTIDFEDGQDSVLTENAPHLAAWASFTDGDFDGLSCLVLLKQGIVYITPPMLTFDTPPFTISWDFETLANFCAFYLVDSAHAVAVYSRRVWPSMCPGGFMQGEWVKSEVFADSGYFQGLWLDYSGQPIGVYAGTFRTTTDGRRVFDGWVSGYLLDVIVAEMHGTWWYDDYRLCPMCGAGHGQFRGRYQYVNDGPTGSIQGVFGDYLQPLDELTLPMYGIWRQDCPAILTRDLSSERN